MGTGHKTTFGKPSIGSGSAYQQPFRKLLQSQQLRKCITHNDKPRGELRRWPMRFFVCATSNPFRATDIFK
jgi:hypothetical protein